jgi:nitrogenase-stabilizing/protective protein
MDEIKQALSKLSSAEEFFNYLDVAYDPRVLNINRLHILKRFNQYLARYHFNGQIEAEIRAEYQALLKGAYLDFVKSDAVTEKVFKVFQDAAGVKTFNVDKLRQSLVAGC